MWIARRATFSSWADLEQTIMSVGWASASISWSFSSSPINSLNLSWAGRKIKKVETMAIFIIFPYLQSWFTSPSLLGAAQNDLDLFKRLQKFSKIDKKISSATSSVLSRHPWYLTEELIPIQHQPTCGGAHITGQKYWIPPSSQSEGLQAPPTLSNCRLLPAGLCWVSFSSSVQPLGDITYLPAWGWLDGATRLFHYCSSARESEPLERFLWTCSCSCNHCQWKDDKNWVIFPGACPCCWEAPKDVQNENKGRHEEAVLDICLHYIFC